MSIQWAEISFAFPYIVPPVWFVALWVFFYILSFVMVNWYNRKEATYEEELANYGISLTKPKETSFFKRSVVFLILAPIAFVGMIVILIEQKHRHKTETPEVINKRFKNVDTF